jgi:hypothetical protein
MTDYVKLENTHKIEIVNGKKIVDEKKVEYENPFIKKIKGEKNGKKYSISIQKRPQNRVTFRVWNPVYKKPRILTPYYPTNNSLKMKKSKKCKTMKKNKKILYKKE